MTTQKPQEPKKNGLKLNYNHKNKNMDFVQSISITYLVEFDDGYHGPQHDNPILLFTSIKVTLTFGKKIANEVKVIYFQFITFCLTIHQPLELFYRKDIMAHYSLK